jgi:hypothetical protein
MEEQGAASDPVVSTRALPVYHIDLDLYLLSFLCISFIFFAFLNLKTH